MRVFLKLGWKIRIFLKGHSEILEGIIMEIGEDFLMLRKRKQGSNTIVPLDPSPI
jgi:hypothetical protein